MGSIRNKINILKHIAEKHGIQIRIAQNKARGNKGFFKTKTNGLFQIDISKNLTETEIISTLLHEIAHFVHFAHDKQLQNLDFVFEDFNNEIHEELIKITVDKIPKNTAQELINKRSDLKKEIKYLSQNLKNFNKTKFYLPPLNYLLKYDRVKIFNTIYSIDNLEKDFTNLSPNEYSYFKLLSKKRLLKRYNNKINKLNKYYNAKTELFARFVETYFTNKDKAYKLAPLSSEILARKINANQIPLFTELDKVLNLNI